MNPPPAPTGPSDPAPACVEDALQWSRRLSVARLDAQLLIGHVLRRDRTWLTAHGEHVLTTQEMATVLQLLTQRSGGVPLSYLVGHREFHGLVLTITPDVLDPRPDTETLVDWALSLMADDPTTDDPMPGPVVDLGTGSGAVALALQAARPGWAVHATDVSPAALAVARRNAHDLALPVQFHEGAWWSAVGDRRFRLAVSNPPYIRDDDPHLAALVHEPRSALTAGPDGLSDLRRLIAGAPAHLLPGAWLLLEHGHDQSEAVAELFHAQGFQAISHRHDLAGHVRCTGGRLAG